MIDISIEIHVSIRNIKISLFLSDIVYSKNINTIHPPLDKWYATLCTLFFCTDTNIFNFYIRSELISFQLFRLFHSSKLLWTAGPIICCKNNRLITSTVLVKCARSMRKHISICKRKFCWQKCKLASNCRYSGLEEILSK